MRLRAVSAMGAAAAILATSVGAATASATTTTGTGAAALSQARGAAVAALSAELTRARPAGVQYTVNWAGYVSNAPSYQASASWVQPAVSCTGAARGSGDAPFLVGLGGGTIKSNSLHQIGTDAVCSIYQGRYYTNYFPVYTALPGGGAHPIYKNVNAGDHMVGSVYFNKLTNSYTLSLRDVTERWSFSTVIKRTKGEGISSAEVVGEVLQDSRGVPIPVPSFRPVTFTGVYLNGRPLVHERADAYVAVGGKYVKEAPTKVYPNNSFAMVWHHA